MTADFNQSRKKVNDNSFILMKIANKLTSSCFEKTDECDWKADIIKHVLKVHMRERARESERKRVNYSELTK